MVSGDGPPDVQQLLREHITTYEQLEALLLARAQAERGCSAEQLADALRVPTATAEQALEGLMAAKLLGLDSSVEGRRYVYLPASAELDETVQRLGRAYEENRLEIVKLMSKSAIERVRTAAMRTFADAFVVGRKKDG